MPEHKSEVARLRQQIEEEYEAAQRSLTSPAIISRHDFITARMEGIERCQRALVQLVGDEQAMAIIADINVATVGVQKGSEGSHGTRGNVGV